MCGRYLLHRPISELAAYFDVPGATPNLAPNWNVAPTQQGLVVRRHPDSGERRLDVLQWGLVPYWAKDAKGGARLINARADGIESKPSFREAFRRRRCIVPMDGFYEWHNAEGRKQPYAAAMADGAPMAAAGLWEGWKAEDGTWLRSYTIVTTDSLGRQAVLHSRSPVLLPRVAWGRWLGEEPAAEEELLGLLRPLDDALLRFWPVRPRVGKVSENDAGLLEPDPSAPELPELAG
jgi:putative SOS response-associated peptidase YedK